MDIKKPNRPIRDYKPLADRLKRPARPVVKQPQKDAVKPKPEPEEVQDEVDDKIIDLYSDFREDVQLQSDKEIAELKRMAQSDLLRFYGWLRRNLNRAKSVKAYKQVLTEAVSSRPFKRLGSVLAVGAIIAFSTIGLYRLFQTSTSEEIVNNQPKFDTLTPSMSESAPKESRFDHALGAYSFQDELDGSPVTVAQQELPQRIKDDPSQLLLLAQSLSSDRTAAELQSNKGVVYRLMTPDQRQTVVFTYQNLLVFISSAESHNDAVWLAYINTLE